MTQTKVTPIEISNPYRFSVGRTAAWTPTAGTPNLVPFDTVEYDPNSNWSGASNYRYTAPVTGLYHFNAMMSCTGAGAAAFVLIFKNGSEWRRGNRDGSNNNNYYGISIDMYLSAGDYVALTMYMSTGSIEAGVSQNWFQGRLVSV